MVRTLADIYRRAAAQVHEILSGANPSGYTPSSSQQVRAGDQFQDGESVGADRAAVSACPCRWGDRIGTRLTVSFVALHEVRHLFAVACSVDYRFTQQQTQRKKTVAQALEH